jgi:REP element-mobilizing transposase RayT
MPNHIHGIIIINKPDSEFKNSPNLSDKQGLSDSLEVGGFAGSNNQMLNDNIPRIIRWFKGRCTFEIRKIQLDFKWQTRYYDRIIRNDQEYNRIKFYIENNIKAWKNDK